MVTGFESFQRAISAKKKRANRINAQKSTGPKSAEGKERSSRNAIKHGVFCEDVLLPGEDEAAFRVLLNGMIHTLNPQNLLELHLVEQIVGAQWRMRRSSAAESLSLQKVGMEIQDFCRRRLGKLLKHFGLEEEQIHDDKAMEGDQTRDDEADTFRLRAMDLGADLELPSAMHLATAFVDPNNAIERFSRYEQRLQQSIHRNLRELERMRGRARTDWDHLPPGPFLEPIPMDDDEEDEDESPEMSGNVPVEPKVQNEQNEPTANPPLASDGQSDGCSEIAKSAPPSPGTPREGGAEGPVCSEHSDPANGT